MRALSMVLTGLFLLLGASAELCGGGTAQYNSTVCGIDATCCRYNWSPNGYGCCPLASAVCCSNQYTCCPKGTTCQDAGSGYSVVTTCVDAGGAAVQTGLQVCKPGAPLPFSRTTKNCLILGDSVSIGYTPHIADQLASECFVQHTPWGGDGGACETAYGLQCLDYFLFSPSGIPLMPDVIMFNFGLHDGPSSNVTIPGQNGNTTVYLPELISITTKLMGLGSKLLFALTSPMLCDANDDWVVRSLNQRAQAYMDSVGIPTVNLHDAVVAKCGPAPQPSCFGEAGCFCPHCVDAGYEWLATSTIVPALRKLL